MNDHDFEISKLVLGSNIFARKYGSGAMMSAADFITFLKEADLQELSQQVNWSVQSLLDFAQRNRAIVP